MPVFNGTSGNDSLTGTGGDDIIRGFAGDDTLIGDAGNDTILGGGGRDFILGGDGDDWIDPGDNGIGSSDYVDTGTGHDIVDLSGQTPFQSYFHLGHGSLNGAGDGIRVLIDSGNNFGFIDKGTAGTTTLVNVNNALSEGPLWGGMGIGGTQYDDEFHIDQGDDGWIEIAPGTGSDLIRIADSDGFVRLGYWDAVAGVVANLGLGTVFQPDGSGGFDIDMIFGRVNEFFGSSHNDRVSGSRLNDQFALGQGDDHVNGKAGFDLVRYDRAGVEAVNVDLAAGTATGIWNGEAFSDRLKNIEAVRGSRDQGDVLKGDDGANSLDGKGGNDTLRGRGGNDTLIGDDGKDKLYGEAGDDILTGGAGNDLFVFADNGGIDLITDFNALNNKEKIDLRGVSGITSFADLAANHLSQVGADAVIDDGAGTVITLESVAVANLNAGDFLF